MKNTFTPLLLFFGILLCITAGVNAQCPGGYSAAELNWDRIDFLPSNNTRYTTYYPAATFPYNQNFTIGTRTVNFSMTPANTANFILNGENAINTANLGTPVVAGEDVQFSTAVTTNNTITITFDLDVANVQFSLFDLDNNQRANITATNTANVAQNITVGLANGASGIALTGVATSRTATGPNFDYANNNNRGSVNVSIAGPVKRIIITLNNAAGDIWFSDMDACVTGSFPNNYHQVSRPFTGQPQYVLTVVNNRVYYTDPATGNSYFLFIEPGHDRLNSMAYDPYKRIVYYTYSLTDRVGLDPAVDKTLKKYDVDTKTISVVIPNVNTFGIPTYESGVESGAATFYNGALYLGIEGYTGANYAASRKSTIWKINFDAAGNPIAPAAQVWGVLADNGTQAQNIHDWSDFGIANGILTDFDGSASGSIEYSQFNLMTGTSVGYTPVGPIPRQVAIGWDEKLYNVDARINLYNGTNGISTDFAMTAPLGPVIPVGSAVASWGDAAGPYRPFLDFGDAPATYDPNPLSPACHDTLTPNAGTQRTKMILGPNEDVEWLKKGFTTVEDNFEDGLSFVPIFSPSSGSYQAQVSLLNNTGSNATLCAWLDYNGNGVFDASESIVPVTIISSPAVRTVWLTWPSITSSLPIGSLTHLRIRLTSSSFNMNASNATGYYSTGEVEDYRIMVDDSPLPVRLISFDADVTNEGKVKLSWIANEEFNQSGYEVERSVGGSQWAHIGFVSTSKAGGMQSYDLIDHNPFKGTSLYRLKLTEFNGHARYSNIQSVRITEFPASTSLSLYPNPVKDKIKIRISGSTRGRETSIYIRDGNGNLLFSQKIIPEAGVNMVDVRVQPSWHPGIYIVQVVTEEKVEYKQFVLQR